jgi:hypothetical protein
MGEANLPLFFIFVMDDLIPENVTLILNVARDNRWYKLIRTQSYRLPCRCCQWPGLARTRATLLHRPSDGSTPSSTS